MLNLLMKTIKEFIVQHKLIVLLMSALLCVSLFAVFLISAIIAGSIEQDKIYTTSFKKYSVMIPSEQQIEELNSDPKELEKKIDNCVREIEKICPLDFVGLVNCSDYQTFNEPAYIMDYIYNPTELFLGRYFEPQEFENKEKKIIATNMRDTHILVGDTMLVNEDAYVVVGISFDYEHRIIYDPTLLASVSINEIRFGLKNIPDEKSAVKIQSVLSENFPDFDIQVPDQVDDSATRDPLLNFLFVALFVLTLLNIIFIYQYLLSKRAKQIIIMRICGATKRRCIFLFLSEILIFSSAVYIPTCLCSHVFMPHLIDFTTNGNYVYALTYSTYILIFVLYLLTVFLVFLPFLVKNISKIKMTKI